MQWQENSVTRECKLCKLIDFFFADDHQAIGMTHHYDCLTTENKGIYNDYCFHTDKIKDKIYFVSQYKSFLSLILQIHMLKQKIKSMETDAVRPATSETSL